MTGRFLGAALMGWLAFGLAACSGPVALYHSAEGGAIAQDRQPPPGLDQPYPNLASVPAAPVDVPAAAQAAIAARLNNTSPSVSPASAQALAGLVLPTAPPPPVPGLTPPPQVVAALAPPPPAPAAVHPPGPAIPLAFAPGSALLPASDNAALQQAAASRGSAHIRAVGFGDGTSLELALARAQRLADALSAAGVPPSAISLSAAQAGSGGFIQLVY